MDTETCPYCHQPITKIQLKEIEKKIERDVTTKFDKKLDELSTSLHEKDSHIKELNQENAKNLDRILTENTHKMNEMSKINDEIIQDLRTARKEDKVHLERLQKDFETVSDKFKKHQSELIGEVGEIKLFETLSEEFKEDSFVTQSRGTSEADIVQTVHYNGLPLDIRICYDNKQKTAVTKAHVDKCKKYQQIHNTKYVFIVSSILPKKNIPNLYYGVKDGIFLVHPLIVLEIVKLVRNNLIEIYTKKTTQQNKNSKESELYEFITGHQFALKLSVLSNCYSKLDELLKSEINSHNRNWKQRRKALDELFRSKIDIEQEINVITGTDIEEIKLNDVTEIEQ
jgi:hypothetical protein